MTESALKPDHSIFQPTGPVDMVSSIREMDFPGEWYELATEDHFWFRWRLAAIRIVINALAIDTRQAARVLDIGCGNGMLMKQLAQCTAWQVDGADLNLEALACHSGGRGRVLYYDILECREEFLDVYDYMTLFDVLEHIPDTRPFLKAALKHLKPGGVFLAGVPALQCLFSIYDTAAGHRLRYDKPRLRSELEDLGVDIIDVRYWGLTQVPLLVLRKLMFGICGHGDKTIRRGFQPPGPWFNALMGAFMRLETSLLRNPIFGSSLILAARKT